MTTPLASKRILLGVAGSIAAYKAADLASKLTQSGALVDVLLTPSALQFVSPLTFQSVTGRKAFTDADLWGGEAHVLHVDLAHNADLLVIAPCSANTLAKLAHGNADNLLTISALAARCPTLIAPAMDVGMFQHPATQTNVATLRQRGVHFVGPAEGRMASGLTGLGRMSEPAEILGEVRYRLSRGGLLRGRKVVVTAGGTQEPLDPVRVIANRSSGKQGFALAQEALDLGADVTLIAGPVHLPTPSGAQRIDVATAQEMLDAVLAAITKSDALLMAAAVADFRPLAAAEQKIKKEGGIPEIHLTTTVDILAHVAQLRAAKTGPRVVVGFAAESQSLIANANAKLEAKKLDLIVANDISAPDAGFAVDTNRVTIVDAGGGFEALPLLSKTQVAERVLERVARLMDQRAGWME